MPGAVDPPEAGAIHVWKVALDGRGRAGARAALGRILAAYLGAEPALATEPGGKPRLAEDPGRLSFNLSHSGELALVAVAAGRVAVGIDVEQVRPRRDLARIATRWLSAEDAAAVTAAAPGGERDRAFYAAWVGHEARVKCTGAGLGGAPPGPEVVALQLAIEDGYAAAVASTLGAARIVLRDASCRG